jgi:hypothetical protein
MIIQPIDYYNPIIHIKPTKIIGVDSQKWQMHIQDFMGYYLDDKICPE